MPPNVHAAALLNHSKFEEDYSFPPFEDSERYLSTNNDEAQTKDLSQCNKDYGLKVWRSLVEGNPPNPNSSEKSNRIHQLLSGIRILDDPCRNQDFLTSFAGILHDAPLDLVEAIREKAPCRFTARVADFNDNLMYAMQSERGLEHLGLSSYQLQEILQAEEYLGSFLTTEQTIPQPPHVDYTWEVLDTYSPDDLKIGFFPLTIDGMFLQVWPRDDNVEHVQGQVIFIPFGKLLILPAHTIHGGGFRTTDTNKGPYGNLRFHLYVAKNKASLPVHQTNKYTEPNNKGMELSWRYTDALSVEGLRSFLFV